MGCGRLLGRIVGPERFREFRGDGTIGQRPLAEDRWRDRQASRLVPVRRAQRALRRRDRKTVSAAGRSQKSGLFKLPG